MINVGTVLENVFNDFHGDYLSDENMIFTKVAGIVKQKIEDKCEIPDEALLCFVRTRTYIRLKIINKERLDKIASLRFSKRSAQKQKFTR